MQNIKTFVGKTWKDPYFLDIQPLKGLQSFTDIFTLQKKLLGTLFPPLSASTK